MERHEQLLRFLKEAESLREVKRRIYRSDGQENTAEHSYQVALTALLLARDVDASRALKIALVHDLVEVFAGDSYIFDEEARRTKRARERDAALKLFGMLPPDLEQEFHALFVEFEAGETREAQLVRSCDRLQPMIHNLSHDGASWKKLGLSFEKIDGEHRVHMHDPEILAFYEHLLREAKDRKLLRAEDSKSN